VCRAILTIRNGNAVITWLEDSISVCANKIIKKFDAILQEASPEEINEYIQTGRITINEARQKYGLPAIPGGDDLIKAKDKVDLTIDAICDYIQKDLQNDNRSQVTIKYILALAKLIEAKTNGKVHKWEDWI